jgi:hypothetical protein
MRLKSSVVFLLRSMASFWDYNPCVSLWMLTALTICQRGRVTEYLCFGGY